MTGTMEREELVEVHGIRPGSGQTMSLLMKVPGISQFIDPYRSYRNDLAGVINTITELATGCPKIEPEGWQNDCNGEHPVWNSTALLRRGSLKEPTKMGAKVGEKRDPSVDFNYYWEVVSFLTDGPSPKTISTDGKTIDEVKLDAATILMLQREFISNDRTALIQAVEFGKGENGNILTDQAIAELVIEWGDLLNGRALQRITQTLLPKPPGSEIKRSPEPPQPLRDGLAEPLQAPPLVQAAVAAGAEVVDVRSVVHNVADMKAVLSAKGVTDAQVRQTFIEAGYEGGKDWLKRNGGTFEDMLAFIERGINGVDEDLPW
mgnify:CR=1 FL=1